MTGSAPKPHQVPISVYSRVAQGITKYIVSLLVSFGRAIYAPVHYSPVFFGSFTRIMGRSGHRTPPIPSLDNNIPVSFMTYV
jgi:hypothetical protein